MDIEKIDSNIEIIAASTPLCQVLNTEQQQTAIQSKNIFSSSGVTADIYHSDLSLSEEQLVKLSHHYGDREINNQWLIKRPRQNMASGRIPNEISLSTDFLTSHSRWIRPFAVVSTMVKDNQTGEYVLLMERAKGLDMNSANDRQGMTDIDVGRMIYQTLMVAHFMSEQGVVGDFGKELRYVKDVEPPRITVFDLACPEKYPPEGIERAEALIKDQEMFLDGFKRNIINKFNLGDKEKIIEIISQRNGSYISFMQMAANIDQFFGVDYEQELLAIEQQSNLPADMTETLINKDDISKVWESINARKLALEQEKLEAVNITAPILAKIGIEGKKFNPEDEFVKKLIIAVPDSGSRRSLERMLDFIIDRDGPQVSREKLKDDLMSFSTISGTLQTMLDGKMLIDHFLDKLFTQT